MLQVLISLSFVLSSFGLDQAFVRDYYEHKEKGPLFKAAFLPGFIFLLLMLIGVEFLSFDKIQEYTSLEQRGMLWMASACMLTNFFNTFLSHSLRMDEKGWEYSLSLLVPKVVFLLSIMLAVSLQSVPDFHFLLNVQLLALVCAMTLMLVSCKDILVSSIKSHFSVELFKELFKFGFPLVFGSVAYWGLTTFDRIALSLWSDLAELGVYSVGVSFAAIGIIFQSIFSTVWSPIVYKWAVVGLDASKIDSVVEHVTAFIVLVFCSVGLLSFLITYLLPGQYFQVQFIVGSCLGFPLLYTLSETTVIGVHIKKKTSIAIIAPMLAFPTNLLLAYLLIPVYGAAGAAVSTSMAFFVFLVVRTESSVRVWRPFKRWKIYSAVLLCLLVSTLQALFGLKMGWTLQLAWCLVLALMIFLFKNNYLYLVKNLIIQLTQMLRS